MFDKVFESKVIRTSYLSRFGLIEVALTGTVLIVKVEMSRISCIKDQVTCKQSLLRSLRCSDEQFVDRTCAAEGITSWVYACGKNDPRLHTRLFQCLVEWDSFPVKQIETDRCFLA
ncbi:hypothetical protein DY000_02026890 [Brassica cretica]|uniref:Uncharacterized protein n=1 Tax=Brassica cretica TaxID=69181 RepID=A0ABQ7E846_BRACR|nr:hypothetical protein DY000_02026890 [Brassica cretica]